MTDPRAHDLGLPRREWEGPNCLCRTPNSPPAPGDPSRSPVPPPQESGGGRETTGRSTLLRASTAPGEQGQGLGSTTPQAATHERDSPAPRQSPAARYGGYGGGMARTWGGVTRLQAPAMGLMERHHIPKPRQAFAPSTGTSQTSVGGGGSQAGGGARPSSSKAKRESDAEDARRGDKRGAGKAPARAAGQRDGEPARDAWGATSSGRAQTPQSTWAQPVRGMAGQPPSLLRTNSGPKGDAASHGAHSARVRPPSSTGRTNAHAGAPTATAAAAVAGDVRDASRPATTVGSARPTPGAGDAKGALGGRKSLTYGPGSQSSQGSSGNQTEVVAHPGPMKAPTPPMDDDRSADGTERRPASRGAPRQARDAAAPAGRPASQAGARPASGRQWASGARPSSSAGQPGWGTGVSSSGGLSEYSIGKVLGEGGFCEVRLGIYHHSKRKVAVKVIDKSRLSDINDRKRVAREIKVLKKLHHACIIRCFDVIDTPSKICIIMENASGGSLLDYVRSKKRLKESEAAKFLQQVVHGLIYCHSKGVVHRDIKLENLLLDSDTNIRIIDFGLSAITAPGKKLKVFCGSPSYAAPEIVARRHYEGPPVDVWSLGVVLFAMVCGYLPFHAGGDRQALCRKIMKGQYTAPDFISADCRDLLQQMLTVDADVRISLKQVLSHPWIAQSTRWTPPTANRYTVGIDSHGSPMAHPEILKRMEALGTGRDDVLDALLHREVNQTTAMYFLLQDQWLEQHAGATSHAHATALVRAATAQGGSRSLVLSGGAGGTRAETAPGEAGGEDGKGGPSQSNSNKETILYGHNQYAHGRMVPRAHVTVATTR